MILGGRRHRLKVAARRSAAAGAERGGLDPVLAGRGAEPAGAVARGVHVDLVAMRCCADAEPAPQVAAQDDGEPGGAACGPPDDGGILRPVEVQVPRLAVVAVEPRVCSGHREQPVDLMSCRVDVAGGDTGEHGPEGLRKVAELGRFSLGKFVRVRKGGPERRGCRPGQVRPGRPGVVLAPGLTRGERVDEADSHGHHSIHVTVEVHLTGYDLAL